MLSSIKPKSHQVRRSGDVVGICWTATSTNSDVICSDHLLFLCSQTASDNQEEHEVAEALFDLANMFNSKHAAGASHVQTGTRKSKRRHRPEAQQQQLQEDHFEEVIVFILIYYLGLSSLAMPICC